MFEERPLYGGAITCDIPASWKDVSDIRQVPDHQECYQELEANAEGALLVIEILQRQEVSDDDAGSFFFRDLAESNGATNVQWITKPTLPFTTTTSGNNNNSSSNSTGNGLVVRCGMGFQKVAIGNDFDRNGNSRKDQQQVKTIRVELCVFRLANVDTDLLVTMSKPIIANPNEPPTTGDQQVWSEAFQRIVSTMSIRDWSLFG